MASNDLVIIGNGFDLTCKLRSSYNDFFYSKFDSKITKSLESLKSIFEEFYTSELEKKVVNFSVYDYGSEEPTPFEIPEQINIWDLIIYFGKESLPTKWSDVESRILEFLIYDSSSSKNKLNIPNFYDMNDNYPLIEKLYDENGEYSSYFYSQLVIFVAAKFKLQNPSSSKEILLEELKMFEMNFSEYLLGLLDAEGWYFYNENAIALFQNIVQQGGSTGLVSQNVLSFNYTTPFSPKEINSMKLKWQNIHGRLSDGNTIFGIDQDKVKVTDISYQFTKTYRQLLQKNDEQKAEQTILPEREKIGRIIFFGHSLSEADYSYFQSIFDYYDIYGS